MVYQLSLLRLSRLNQTTLEADADDEASQDD